jgi:ABC-type phosphate transport system substrate-binding protein
MQPFSLRRTKFVGGAVAVMVAGVVLATDMTGAGSTVVYPILSKWSADYSVKTGDHLNYQSIGSGGEIAQMDRHRSPTALIRSWRRRFPTQFGPLASQ